MDASIGADDFIALFEQHGAPAAVFLSKRAKTGSWLDENQINLGVITSKLMQHEYRHDG